MTGEMCLSVCGFCFYGEMCVYGRQVMGLTGSATVFSVCGYQYSRVNVCWGMEHRIKWACSHLV